MQFTPKTEAELQKEEDDRLAEFLWPAQECDFEIPYAGLDKTSSKGNDMIELQVTVYNADGKKQNIFDYLMPKMAFKFRHAAYACGLGELYESGNITGADFEGKAGRCLVKIQAAQNGYAAKNVIEDYVVTTDAQVQATAAKTVRAGATQLNDDIPF